MYYSKQTVLSILALFLANFTQVYSQAEYPSVSVNYVRINDNSKKVKEAKVYKCVELRTFKGNTDTSSVKYYDNNGYLFQQIIFVRNENEANSLKTRLNYSYLYDKDGKLIQRIDSSGEDVAKTFIAYDEYSNISKEETKMNGESIYEASYDYDDLSRLIEASEKNKIDNCRILKTYAYDSYNNLSKVTVKNSCDNSGNKAITTTYGYKYDKRSNIIEKQTVYSTGGIRTETFKYDDKGFFTERYESNSKDSYNKYIYTNDYQNFTIKVEKTEVSGENISTFVNSQKYDKYWNPVEEQYAGPEGEIYSRHILYEFY